MPRDPLDVIADALAHDHAVTITGSTERDVAKRLMHALYSVYGAEGRTTAPHPMAAALAPRDDEARIERAARADEAVDAVTRACREADPWFVAEGGSTLHWARDHFLPALRAEGYVVALAAADQEEKP